MDVKALGEANVAKTIYSSGRLLFIRGGTLLAQSFDPERLTASGEAISIAERIAGSNFDASANGTLVYARFAEVESRHLT